MIVRVCVAVVERDGYRILVCFHSCVSSNEANTKKKSKEDIKVVHRSAVTKSTKCCRIIFNFENSTNMVAREVRADMVRIHI